MPLTPPGPELLTLEQLILLIPILRLLQITSIKRRMGQLCLKPNASAALLLG